ncbi:hypothetical protein [Streptomyces flavofungini]|uniref:Zf-HC2 domain-containing protein n=1 Tax=Streptomyces flavofungini TaxID=68200 RepID=A0ABS0X967_9ACTN|nr:hypothetical protein [Streptomyces flavofungini]MBJ3809742.1 hypothetical protein [Streptomyces flavofungini]GHC80462.1 hypothetical protein GCM10010349_62930 [Streptomyces flavofungini]
MTTTDHATSRADELYRIHLRHLDACPACGRGDGCGQGARLRRAVRAARLAADRRTPPWR